MVDGPAFRVWPPVALGAPLLTGMIVTAAFGDPFPTPSSVLRSVGAVLCGLFAVWNGWALLIMAASRTALLPGGATRTIIRRGPFAISRNPLYVGLIALYLGIALLWTSEWAALFVPGAVALLVYGAIRPEEEYLSTKFGAEYEAYRAKVGRWL